MKCGVIRIRMVVLIGGFTSYMMKDALMNLGCSMILKKLIDIHFQLNIYMGSKSYESCASENMKQREELDINEPNKNRCIIM